MAIFASPLSREEIINLMQRISTRTHALVQDIYSIDRVFAQVLDSDLEETLGGESPTAEVNALRSLIAALKGYADNYSGLGSISDKSYEIAKRVKPVV